MSRKSAWAEYLQDKQLMAVSDRARLLVIPLYSIKFIHILKINAIDVFYRLKHKNLIDKEFLFQVTVQIIILFKI